mmetsp:Transcript_58301/g.180826  ORF Transcript_58301/g.180826 Transcript_58301/m.180826 type:complete len:210 (-) Transcript_58301:491-1120(-)
MQPEALRGLQRALGQLQPESHLVLHDAHGLRAMLSRARRKEPKEAGGHLLPCLLGLLPGRRHAVEAPRPAEGLAVLLQEALQLRDHGSGGAAEAELSRGGVDKDLAVLPARCGSSCPSCAPAPGARLDEREKHRDIQGRRLLMPHFPGRDDVGGVQPVQHVEADAELVSEQRDAHLTLPALQLRDEVEVFLHVHVVVGHVQAGLPAVHV